MNLTCWFFKSSLVQRWPAFKVGDWRKKSYTVLTVLHYSKPLINFSLPLLYVLANYLTSIIFCSKLPFRSCTIIFHKLYSWNPAKPIDITTFPMLLYFGFLAPPSGKLFLSPASHTDPRYLYTASPLKLNSKTPFSREVPLIYSVGRSRTFFWTSRGFHMALIVFSIVLQPCLLCLTDQI